jgi:hypothetical protein
VSNALRAGDVDEVYALIYETMKLFGNSAHGKCMTKKEKLVSTTFGTFHWQ